MRATAPRARRYADVIAGLSSDLGGSDNLSNAEKLLIARAANLNLQCEIKEQHWGEKNDHEAGPKDVMTYQTLVNSLRRVLEALYDRGFPRRAKNITPSLRGYIEQKANGHSSEALDEELA